MRAPTLALVISLAAPASAQPDDSAGRQLAAISRQLREFQKNVLTKKFDEAERLLHQAQSAYGDLGTGAKSHPDYDDVRDTIRKAPVYLDNGRERDRRARLHAKIDDLLTRADAIMLRAEKLAAALGSRPPTDEDLGELDAVVAEAHSIVIAGRGYFDQERWAQMASSLEHKAEQLAARRLGAAWQIVAMRRLGPTLDDAFGGAKDYQGAKTPQAQIAGLSRAAKGFEACVRVAAELARDTAHDPNLLVNTALGKVTFGRTKTLCEGNAVKGRDERDRVSWRLEIKSMVGELDAAMERLRKAKSAADKLPASEDAVAALVSCERELQAAADQPGVQPKYEFSTSLGDLPIARLESRCAKEAARLEAKHGLLSWQAEAEGLAVRVTQIHQAASGAARLTTPSERVDGFGKALAGYVECRRIAAELVGHRDADRRFAVRTPLGKQTIADLRDACARQHEKAAKRQAKALQEQDLEAFVATCRGDEVSMARREGIPSSIESFHAGRVFTYAAGGKSKRKSARSYSFDRKGLKTDFAKRWREQMRALVSELERVDDEARTASDGAAALAAAKAGLAVFPVCVELLVVSRKEPGFDSGQVFDTPLGKLTANGLERACAKQQRRTQSSLPRIEWRVEIERLVGKMVEAKHKLETAAEHEKATEQIELLEASLSGFQSCADEARALMANPNADRRLKMKTALGALNGRGLIKACQRQTTEAERRLADAQQLEKLQSFLATCKGDETRVARKHGPPNRVEPVGTGRVFVYVVDGQRKKGKERRFAFDASGKQVNEKALLPQPAAEKARKRKKKKKKR